MRIQERETRFWRYQSLSPNYLATIEAVYWFFYEYFSCFESCTVGATGADTGSATSDTITRTEYDGRYDGLLVYFQATYDRIQQEYRQSGKSFTQRHSNAAAYIQKSGDVMGSEPGS